MKLYSGVLATVLIITVVGYENHIVMKPLPVKMTKEVCDREAKKINDNSQIRQISRYNKYMTRGFFRHADCINTGESDD
jgi:hypothetical protein